MLNPISSIKYFSLEFFFCSIYLLDYLANARIFDNLIDYGFESISIEGGLVDYSGSLVYH